MLTQFEDKMTKTLENLESEYTSIRAGRANPNILNKIKVEYYGVPTPMQQLANITVPEARTLMIAPWEPSLVKDIKKKGEQAKVAIRNIRRDANDGFKKQLKANEISEDEQKDNEDKIQKLTDKYVGLIDKAVEAKSNEIMTV